MHSTTSTPSDSSTWRTRTHATSITQTHTAASGAQRSHQLLGSLHDESGATYTFISYSFLLCFTTVAYKRSRSFCQKCRWQVTAKHTCTLCMWLCMKWHGAWLYGVHNMHQDGGSFMWHQPCQRCKYTTSVDTEKRRYKELVNHVPLHANAVNLLERAENNAI